MADKRISQLNSHTSPSGSDILVIVNNNETKKITYADLSSAITGSQPNISALNIFTESIDSRVDILESWSSSLDSTFATDLQVSIVSSSVAATIGIVSQNTGLVTTSSFNEYTASISTASLVDRLDNLESHTGSYLTSLNGTISGSSQLTSSYDERYVISGSITQTTWDNIANKPSGIVSQSTDLTSLNNFTASISTASLVDRLNVIESVSGSWITESQTGSFLTSLSGAISSSEQVLGSSGVYSSSAQINGNIYSAGSSFTFQDLLIGAGTTFGKITTDGSKYISVMPTYNVESARFWTNGNVTIQDGGDYVDNGFRLEVSGSTRIIGSFNATDGITGSTNFDTIANKPTLISGSSQLTSSYDTRYTLSGSVVSGTTPVGTISGSAQISAFGFVSGSYTTTASFNSFTASAQTVTTGSNSFNGTQIITGSLIVTSGSFIGSQLTANTSSLYLTSGSNLYVQNNGLVEITGSLIVSGSTNLNVNSLLVGTGSGDEGGEIQLAVPQTNTSLTNKVIIDVFQNRLRFWEAGADSKGVYVDLSKTPAGNAGELLWKASGMVAAGTFVTLDNLKCTITTSGSRGLSIGAVSTNFEADLSGWYTVPGGSGGGSTNNISYTTTASASAFGWNLGAHGDMVQVNLRDKTNDRFYRITMMIGVSYISNFISIERLF
jgi:hypothetical protein